MNFPSRAIDYHKPPYNEKLFTWIPGASRVLDIGCASGKLGEALRRLKGCTVEGVEKDPKLAQAAGRVLDRIHTVDLDAEELPYFAAPFDAIVFGDTLEHLADPEKVLSSCRLIMKDGARLFVSCPNVTNWQVRLNLLFGRYDYNFALTCWDHLHHFTLQSLKALLEHCGYRVVRVTPRNNRIRILGKIWPTLFAFQFVVEAVRR